ncbi:granulin a [Boleophthalmus pectinirostris]|uniref:granulin a n=1 Tax=Boleophthalmus pectinirostris TaxID=150288 RepID=UPI00242A8DDE|nr:granulin a [Boleophthalmus pectinirostris]
MLRWVVTCFVALLVCGVWADECPSGGHCGEGQTCCKHPTNGYECCPFDKAECCGDHVHCCPTGMTCEKDQSKCVNASLSVPWAERTSTWQPGLSNSFRMIKSYIGEDADNICPDQSRCPAEFSCLRALTKYACCPLAQGIPCSDGKHCCPEGHSCSEDSRSCIKKAESPAVLCSDGVSECPAESSCCEGSDGEFGCCPMTRAVCCDDKTHCCPEGSLCDLQNSKCVSVTTKKELPMWAKFPARRRAEWENQKEEQHVNSETSADKKQDKFDFLNTVSAVSRGNPACNVSCDSQSFCHDQNTCCSDGHGGWNCCPVPNAVCCGNHYHCCPPGYKCDLGHVRCLSDTGSTPLLKPQQTCTPSPGPNSAPQVESQTTAPGQGEQAESKEEEDDEEEEEEEEEDDEEGREHCSKRHACPRNSTCCRLGHRRWGCCPLPKAVCCRDGKHCCPHHYLCHHVNKSCAKNGVEIPWYTKLPTITKPASPVTDKVSSLKVEVSNTTCDKSFACDDDATCCSDGKGSWLCCPAPKAVCCDDHMHCCPHGTTCDLKEQMCVSDSDSTVPTTPMAPTTTAAPFPISTTEPVWTTQPSQIEEDEIFSLKEEVSNVTCDKTSYCPDDTTCCLNVEGSWSCCPIPEAVCCEDHIHCCPHGTTCDLKEQMCVSDSDSTVPTTPMAPTTTAAPFPISTTEPVWTTQPSQTEEDESEEEEEKEEQCDDEDMVSCDHKTKCPRCSTCCRLGHGWGCCPVPHAVCCSDGTHCCPAHHKCSQSHKACVRDDDVVIPWYTKLPALSSPEKDSNQSNSNDVECKDKRLCHDHETCCQLASGQYGCCPLEDAVCCDDKEHCPHGSTCDPEGCLSSVFAKVQKVPLTLPKSEPDEKSYVMCGQTACPKGFKCCGNNYCCPFLNGVCCKNSCCPFGQICTEHGECSFESFRSWVNWLFSHSDEKKPFIL